MELIGPDEPSRLDDLGPEPLGNSFNGPYLAGKFKTKLSPVKSALLDQRIVAGLGNIYVCEALFRAGISPKSKCKSISKRRIEPLVTHIKDVLNEAIEAGGSSLKDFSNTDGDLGYFQHTFSVYGREGENCPKCQRSIKRIVQSGRSSFYCPACQR